MTNTRITDPEILERRYPVLCRQFSLRLGSGGDGHHRGGDGVVRELEFMRPLTVSILSERRALQPYGMNGGGCGARGRNILKIAPQSLIEESAINASASRNRDIDDSWKRIVNLGGKSTVSVTRGDRLCVYTPGGGGYGISAQKINQDKEQSDHVVDWDAIKPIPPSSTATLSAGSLNQYILNQEGV